MPAPRDSEALSLWGHFAFCFLIFDFLLSFLTTGDRQLTTSEIHFTLQEMPYALVPLCSCVLFRPVLPAPLLYRGEPVERIEGQKSNLF